MVQTYPQASEPKSLDLNKTGTRCFLWSHNPKSLLFRVD